MKLTRLILLMLVALLVAALGSCGGGENGGSTTPPPFPPPEDEGPGGDPNQGTPPRRPLDPFGSPFADGYGDLRGIAATREFVYVADTTTLYAFDKLGNFRNAVATVGSVRGLSVFPAVAATELPTVQQFYTANCPLVAHAPVGAWGVCTIYPPGLDPAATREDAGNPDARRIDAMPTGNPPIDPPNAESGLLIPRVYDTKVDRHGSVLTMLDIDIKITPVFPDYPRAMMVNNRYLDGYLPEVYGTTTIEVDGEDVEVPLPFAHRALGNVPVGDFDFDTDTNDITPTDWVNLGKLAVDRLQPPFITTPTYQLYLSAGNFLRDYVGVTTMDVAISGGVPSYTIGPEIPGNFGYGRVIGGPSGGSPGSFSPRGVPGTDPDLTQGGPSGMAVDPRNNNLYVCDPGNGRIQVFDPSGNLVEILSGFTAPSSVAVDLDGNVFICDVNQVRVIYRTLPDAAFGNVGGTVRNSVTNTPLQGVLIQLRDESDLVFETEVSNINGQYLFENLPVGNYYLVASKFNYESDFPREAIQIRKDLTVQVDFNMTPQTGVTVGQYSGMLIDSFTKLPITAAEVRLVGTNLNTTTDINGRWTIDNIPAGTYQVLFSHDGYETVTKDVTILRGQTTEDNNLQMTPIL